jgi:hypothetical protein
MLIVGEEIRAVVNVKGLASTIVPNIHLSQLEALIDRAEEVLAEADQQLYLPQLYLPIHSIA